MATTGESGRLIDTDVLIDAARGLPEAISFVTAAQAADGITISAISAMELVAGCRDKRQLAEIQQFLDHIVVVPMNESISHTAYALMVEYHLSHGLMLPDALVAATALVQGFALITRNSRHYQMIPALRLTRPY